MTKFLPPPERSAPKLVVPIPAADPAIAAADAPRQRTPSVQYLDFETTARGREYTLRAFGGAEPRLFVLVIPNEAFDSRTVRFQDGPDLCFRRLQRELTAAPDLEPGDEIVLTSEELGEYRAGREQPANERRRRGSGA